MTRRGWLRGVVGVVSAVFAGARAVGGGTGDTRRREPETPALAAGQSVGGRPVDPMADSVLVRNRTGRYLRQYEVVELPCALTVCGGPSKTPIFLATHTYPDVCVMKAIMQEPVIRDRIGRATIQGATWARVRMRHAEHCCAEVVRESAGALHLESCERGGDYEIVYVDRSEATDDPVHAIVQLRWDRRPADMPASYWATPETMLKLQSRLKDR
jgi:hypothetical protein